MQTNAHQPVAARSVRNAQVARRALDSDVRRGMAAMTPMLVGYAPFAILIGVSVGASPSPVAALSGSWLVFAGTAHLTVVQLVSNGAGALGAAAPAVLVNLRLLLFSTTIAQHWRGTSRASRLLAAATVVEPTWAIASRQGESGESSDRVRRSYAGAALLLWVGWPVLIGIGAILGPVVPVGAGIALLAPLCLVSLAVPRARSRSGIAAVLVGVAVTLLADGLPGGIGLLLGTAAGTVAGTATARLVHPSERTSA